MSPPVRGRGLKRLNHTDNGGEIRVASHGLAEVRDGLLTVAEDAKGIAQVVVGLGEIWLESERGLELGDSGLTVVLIAQGQAEIDIGFSEIGLQPQRGAATADRSIELPQRAVRLRQVAVKDGRPRLQRDGLADQVNGRRVIALLMTQHAKQVKGVRVARIAGQHLLIQPGSPRQLARLVHFKGGSK